MHCVSESNHNSQGNIMATYTYLPYLHAPVMVMCFTKTQPNYGTATCAFVYTVKLATLQDPRSCTYLIIVATL